MNVSENVLDTAKKLTELCKLHIEAERMGEHQEQVMDCVAWCDAYQLPVLVGYGDYSERSI